MSSDKLYDVVIIGGGLAGLSLAILLAREQYSVLVLEKDAYPRHKVCGEYISLESQPFLERLGLPVSHMDLPLINKLVVTDSRGNEVHADLPQGGFGISRYKLDEALANLATAAGATLLTRNRADSVVYANDNFEVTSGSNTWQARVVCGAWGKRSNMDIKLKRPFVKDKKNALSNYVGIKYHIRYPWQRDLIGLHNFTDGYCGISQVEDDICCFCNLTTAAALQRSGNDIKRLEQEVMMKNPWLNKIFSEAEFLYESPMAISQVSFEQKEQVLDHMLLLGDTAGLITPLCGNGMSMAFHAAALAGKLLGVYLQGGMSRSSMEQRYASAWRRNFSLRTGLGRVVQSNFGKDRTTALFIKTMGAMPFLSKALIKGTSGRPF